MNKVVASVMFAVPLALVGCGEVEEDVSMTRDALLNGMNFYYGNLHGHTKYSDGSGTASEGYAFGRDTAGMDFYSITDHAELLSSTEWSDTLTQANAFNQDGAFVALRGFEYTNYASGHINVFDTTSYRSFWSSMTLSSFYSWLDSNNGLGQFNHPGDPGSFGSFGLNAKAVDNMSLLETANGSDTNASGTYVNDYNDALKKGWKVAPVGNNDNHKLADAGRRTVLVATDLTRSGLLTAMRARRMYSSDDHNLEVAFVLNGAWMGSTVPGSTGEYQFDVTLQDDEAIARVELVVKGAVTQSLTPAAGTTSLVWHPTLSVSADTYAYLKVTESDGQVAITAPIWIDLP